MIRKKPAPGLRADSDQIDPRGRWLLASLRNCRIAQQIPCNSLLTRKIPCSQGIWRQESNGACCADSVRPETALIQGWKPVFRKDHATENRYPLFLKML